MISMDTTNWGYMSNWRWTLNLKNISWIFNGPLKILTHLTVGIIIPWKTANCVRCQLLPLFFFFRKSASWFFLSSFLIYAALLFTRDEETSLVQMIGYVQIQRRGQRVPRFVANSSLMDLTGPAALQWVALWLYYNVSIRIVEASYSQPHGGFFFTEPWDSVWNSFWLVQGQEITGKWKCEAS